MKSLNARKIFFSLLVAASLCSYGYLNTIGANHESVVDQSEELNYFEEEVQKDVILPDVKILQKVIETGRRIIPSSR